MHEAALMRGLMRRLHRIAEDEQARRITAVRVRLGALSHFSPAHFEEHFARAARGSVAEGAALHVTVSGDAAAPDAQDVTLEEVDIETGAA